MKLALTPTFLLVLNLSAAIASHQHLHVLVPIGTWDVNYWWRELPSCVQDAAAVYGYDEKSWDDGDDLCPDFCEEWWKDLTDEQKWASFVFGYDEEIWNN
eukprot:scaffold11596_cov79-Skeletonema_dohrnii-CCMP3373.AAC.5